MERSKETIKQNFLNSLLMHNGIYIYIYICHYALINYIYIYVYVSVQAAHTTYKLSSPSYSTRAIQKSLTLNKKHSRIFWKKVRRTNNQHKNDKTEKATGLGTKTREEIGKGDQMTALRFQTEETIKHQIPHGHGIYLMTIYYT